MEKQVIFDFVNNGWQSLADVGMAHTPHDVPPEMRDDTREAQDDWIPWKLVDSTVTDNDLTALEALAGRKLPPSYKVFLQYKHFYELDAPNPMEVVFFPHPLRHWMNRFAEYYSHDWVKERLLAKGYVPFADHQDWGIVCFDTSRGRADGEYPIVMIDHELVYDNPIPYEEFGNGFIDMIKKRLMP